MGLCFSFRRYCYNELTSVANDEHLKMVRQGVATWNDWQEKNLAGMLQDFAGGTSGGGARARETRWGEPR
jgi:hypothetical protein